MTPAGTDAADLVPHRPPILFIDRVLAEGPEHVSVEREVRASDWWLEPGPAGQRRVAVGGLLEGMAQSAAVLFAQQQQRRRQEQQEPQQPARQPGPLAARGRLVGVRDLVVSRPAREGERIVFSVELVRRLPPFVLVACTAHVGGEQVASGELRLHVEEAPRAATP